MGYKVLVTLDLSGATEEQRQSFYEVLVEEHWNKIPNLTTVWRASFLDSVSRESAINTMQNDLLKAKSRSKIKTVYYAMQLDQSDVIINHFK
jgi:hypothetical protein